MKVAEPPTFRVEKQIRASKCAAYTSPPSVVGGWKTDYQSNGSRSVKEHLVVELERFVINVRGRWLQIWEKEKKKKVWYSATTIETEAEEFNMQRLLLHHILFSLSLLENDILVQLLMGVKTKEKKKVVA